MNKEKGKKKGMPWFKTGNSDYDEIDQTHLQNQGTVGKMMSSEHVNDSKGQDPSTVDFLSKDNKDKLTLDVLVSLENILKDRQLTVYQNNGLKEQLHTLNEITNRLKQDHVKKHELLEEQSQKMRTLENHLTQKQMSYDQLLEDYKEFQGNAKIEYDKITHLLEIETNKYIKLSEEATNTQYQNMLKVNDLEETIRNLEIENQRYIEDYQTVLDDKAELMETINDFTERMSFSFSPKAPTSNSED